MTHTHTLGRTPWTRDRPIAEASTRKTQTFIVASSEHISKIEVQTWILYFLFLLKTFSIRYSTKSGPGSSVGIATDYGLPPVQTCPVAHPASSKMGTGSFLGVKCGRGVLLTTHLLLVPRSWKSRAIPLPTLWPTPDL